MISSLKLKFKSFSARRALFVGSDKVTIYHWAKGKLGSSYVFEVSENGFEYFGRYLTETRNDPIYLLLDSPDEEYRMDTIPHAFGADRRALISRKQQRMFHGTPYYYAAVQGREKTGRRDDEVMFSAIANPKFIQPWLEILETYKVPVASVTTVPLLLQEIGEIIPNMSGNALIFSLQSGTGLRQSYFQNGTLKFSRLVKMPRYGTEHYAPILTDELGKVKRHISSSADLVGMSGHMDVYFLGNQELLTELGKTHVDSDTERYHFLDWGDLAKRVGLLEQSRVPFSDKYFIYQLLRYTSRNCYATSRDMRYFKMRAMNSALKFASVVLILSSFVLGSMDFFEGRNYQNRHKVKARNATLYDAKYSMSRERISELPVEPSDLKVAVDAYNTLERYKADPVGMFKLISLGMDKFPDIQIKRMKWAASTNPDYDMANTRKDTVAVSVVNPVDAEYAYYQIAEFDAYVEDFDGRYRQALAKIDRFTEFLREVAFVHGVSILSLPLDIGSGGSLAGSVRQGDVSTSDFSVRVVLGVKQ